MEYKGAFEHHIMKQMSGVMTSRSRQIREAINWIYETGGIPVFRVDLALWKTYDPDGKYPIVYLNDVRCLGKRGINQYRLDDDILQYTVEEDGVVVAVSVPTFVITELGILSEGMVNIPLACDVDVEVFTRKYGNGLSAATLAKDPNRKAPRHLTLVK